MSSNLKVNTILPSTGTTIGIGTVGGLINVVGNIDVNSTSGISTFNGLEISGIVTAKAGAAVTYYGDGSNLTGITAGLSNIVEDTSPQLGGDLASNSNDILMAANDRIVFGSDALRVKHTGSHADIENTTGNITIKNDSSSSTEQILIQAKGGEDSIKAIANGAVELYHNNTKRLETVDNSPFVGISVIQDVILNSTGDSAYRWAVGGNASSNFKWSMFYSNSSSSLNIFDNVNSRTVASFKETGAIELNYQASKKFETTSSGVTVTGAQTITGGSSDNLKIDMTGANDPYINFREGSTNKCFMQWDAATDDLRIYNYDSVTDLRIGEGGIMFGGDTTAANALDDYEEGSYSPTMTGSGGGSFGMNPHALRYTKVGRVVHVSGRLYIHSSSGLSGSEVRMSLPYANSSAISSNDAHSYSYVTTYNAYNPNSDYQMVFSVLPGNSYGVFLWVVPNAVWQSVSPTSHMNQNAAYYGFDFTYTTAT